MVPSYQNIKTVDISFKILLLTPRIEVDLDYFIYEIRRLAERYLFVTFHCCKCIPNASCSFFRVKAYQERPLIMT